MGEIPRSTGSKASASSVLQCHGSRRLITIKSRCQYGDSQLLLLFNNLLIISFYLFSACAFADQKDFLIFSVSIIVIHLFCSFVVR